MAARSKVAVNSVTPFLWFEKDAEKAVKFYTALFKRSKIKSVSRTPGKRGGPGPAISLEFELAGQPFIALNGGPHYKLTPAFSMFVSCPNQRAVDTLWKALTKGGEESMCGWLVDKYGVSWQIIPTKLMDLLYDPDPERASRTMSAMLTMRKIDIKTLEKAARG